MKKYEVRYWKHAQAHKTIRYGADRWQVRIDFQAEQPDVTILGITEITNHV